MRRAYDDCAAVSCRWRGRKKIMHRAGRSFMKALLVYPEWPDTYWSFKHALPFEGKRSVFPPLGLLTVASLLPQSWEQRLVDVNIRPVSDADLDWADVVLISAMLVQKESMLGILSRC